ncbi:collagen alpha-1(I) chain-like [Prinia subflava]|uniref:collagen alpha-1(I) chain-like n=1 Tax=Prinia subflava TaxID=208062 RepID=UPI002FE19559
MAGCGGARREREPRAKVGRKKERRGGPGVQRGRGPPAPSRPAGPGLSRRGAPRARRGSAPPFYLLPQRRGLIRSLSGLVRSPTQMVPQALPKPRKQMKQHQPGPAEQGNRASWATGELQAFGGEGRPGRGPRRQLAPARLPQPRRRPCPVGPARAGPSVPLSRPVHSGRALQGPRGAEGAPPRAAVTRGCPRHLRRVTERERGPGHGAGEGEGAAPPARGNFGKRLQRRPPPPPRAAPSDGRSRSLSPPPVVRGSGLLPSPSPSGVGAPGSGCPAPPVGPGACGDLTCQRERRVRALQSRGREEVPGGSGRQFPRKNLPHSLNVNDSKRGVLPLH